MGAWNLGGGLPQDDLLDGSLNAPAGPAGGPAFETPPDEPRGEAWGQTTPHHGFTLGETVDETSLGSDGPVRPGATTPQSKGRWPALPPQPRPGGLGSLPTPGEVLGGFRMVSELGRGAFARVFLAEQINLGGRLVALKVSCAEGDEPQMLARLQHTHIVPINSVYDDPETGLRLMCMPFLGGANLAQVLEVAGGRTDDGLDRRSLVDALDEVIQRLQTGSVTGRSSLPEGAFLPGTELRPVGTSCAVGPPPVPDREGRPGPDQGPPSLSRGSMTRWDSLWGRLARLGTGAAAPAGASAERLDFDQPARQFLRASDTVRASAWVIARLAEGLEHAHSRGLLHRDLKPSNILIADDGTPMLLDFNMSSSSEASDPAVGEKAMLGGTLPYMSPEHLDAFNPRGNTPPQAVGERSDVYALGLILFEMIAGEHPFPEPPRLPLLELLKILAEQRSHPPSLRASQPGVPWGLDSVVRKCLAPDPAKRYARARDLAEDLNRFLDDLPLRHAPETSPRERLAKWSRRNPRLCGGTSIAGFAALLVIALGGMIGFLQGSTQQLASRLKLQVFRDNLAECRLLLNLSSGPVEHLRRGVTLARRTLDQQRINGAGAWGRDSWAHRLDPGEQVWLREQTSELILMEARARVYLAERAGGEAERRQALGWAVEWLNRAERLDADPPSALFADRACYLAALGRGDLAADDRRREAAKAPVTSRDFALLGAALLSRGDLVRAEPALLRAIDLDPRAFWAWFALGHCHSEQGRHLDAAGDFAACVALEPKFAWTHMNRGLALAHAGRLGEARSSYHHALAANPRFAEAWLNLALVELERNDLAAAERGLNKAMELGRRESGVLAALAEIKARRGDRAGAEELFDGLLRDRPDDPVVLTARGVFRIATDRDGARSDLRRVLEANPGNARARYGMALLLRTVNPREALAEADAALRDDPNLLDALQLRALLRARLGDRAAVADAERLVLTPTPHRLYNAACALSLLVGTADADHLATRALDLLARALDAGFPASQAASDPDLRSLRNLPGYRETLDRHRGASAPAG